MQQIKLTLYIFLGFLYVVQAQNFHFNTYTTVNGMPSNEVRDIVRDTFGFLWIATDNGLLRFDGTSFKAFHHSIGSQYGRSFCQVKGGFLYSHDAGISFIQPNLDKPSIRTYLKASIDATSNELYYPDKLFQQTDGSIWISQLNGSLRKIKEGQVKDFFSTAKQIDNTNKNTLSSNIVVEVNQQHIWVAKTSGELYFLMKIPKVCNGKGVLLK